MLGADVAVGMPKGFLEKIKFDKISRLHVLTSIPLLIAIYALLRVYYVVSQRIIGGGFTGIGGMDLLTLSLLGFYPVYVLASTFSIYKLYDKLVNHIVYSSLALYQWCKEVDCEYQAIVRTGLEKRKIPSPATTVILNLLTLGVVYPILLGLFERYISIHSFSEEIALFRKTRVLVKSSASILFDIALLLLTSGLYLVYWIYRGVKRFNKHIDVIHKNHPNPPVEPSKHGFIGETRSLALILGLLLFFTGIHSLATLILPTIPSATVLGFGFTLPYIAYLSRRRSLLAQSLIILLFEYTYMLALGVVGLVAYPFYSSVLKSFEEQTRQIVSSRSIVGVTTFIFLNNIKIALAALIPVVGMSYAGYALSNTGFVYGLLIGYLAEKSIGQALSALAVLISPHAPLELYSYALSLSIATRVGREPLHTLTLKAIISIIILFTAAVIEALLIVSSPFPPKTLT